MWYKNWHTKTDLKKHIQTDKKKTPNFLVSYSRPTKYVNSLAVSPPMVNAVFILKIKSNQTRYLLIEEIVEAYQGFECLKCVSKVFPPYYWLH